MSFSRNVLIYASADVLGAGIGLIVSPISTRLLTTEQYGVIPLLGAVWAVVAVVQYGGMDWAFPFFRSKAQNSKVQVLASATILASLGVVFVWTLFVILNMYTPFISKFAGANNFELRLFLISILPASLLNWYLYILRYENKAIAFARISLLGRTLSMLLALPAMAYVDQEIRLAVFFGVSGIVSCFAVVWALFELRSIGLYVYKRNFWLNSLAKQMLNYGLLLVPGGIIYSMTTIVDRLFIGAYLGPSGTAILAVALAVGTASLMLKQWFARAWDPKMIEWLRSENEQIYLPRLQLGIQLLIFGLVPLPIIILIWIEPIINVLYPPQYASVSFLIPPLIAAGVISTFSLVGVATVIIADTVKWHTPIYSIALLVNAVACIFFIPIFGVFGAVLGTLLSEIFILLSWICIGRIIYLNLKLNWAICLLVLGFVVFIVVFASHGKIFLGVTIQERITLSCLFGSAWFVCIWLLKPLKGINLLRDEI